jgi:hypothetical protein
MRNWMIHTYAYNIFILLMDYFKKKLVLEARESGHVPKLRHSSEDRTRKMPQRMKAKWIEDHTGVNACHISPSNA